MKHLYILGLLFATILPMQAQVRKMTDIDVFKKRVEKEASTIKSIESDFTQVKHLDIFNEDVTSKGKFYYKSTDKINLDYLTPTKYQMVINGGKIKTISNGKKTIMNLKSNKVMKEMQGMLAACMSGNISQISGYSLDYFEDASNYLIKVKTINKTVQAYVTGFDIYMDKKDLSVTKLRILEAGKNHTDYLFQNRKFNTLKDDSKFSVN